MSEKLNILVVEDKIQHLESAKILLDGEYNLRAAVNFNAAVKELGNQKPDVLLSDMNFPLGEPAMTQDNYSPRPLGYALALYAARPHIAVPRIAILTDTNHHSDAVSDTFDRFIVEEGEQDLGCEAKHYSKAVLRLNDSIFVMLDERDNEETYKSPEGSIVTSSQLDEMDIPYEQAKIFYENQVKNWKGALEKILSVDMGLFFIF